MNMLPKPGIEPGTFRSSVRRSPNLAISADLRSMLKQKMCPLEKPLTLKKVVTEFLNVFMRAFIAFDGESHSDLGIRSNGRARA